MGSLLTRLFPPPGLSPAPPPAGWLVGLHHLADGLLGLAYLAITALLMYVARRRRDVPFPALFGTFGAFLVACGLTHFLEVLTFPVPAGGLSGGVKALTAGLAWATVFALAWMTPRALTLRSPDELEHEIAERRRVEHGLRERETMLAAIFESAPDAIVIVNRHGRITRVNTQTERLFGYGRHELINEPLATLLPERCRQPYEDHRTRALAGPDARPPGTGLELYGRRRDGSEFPVDLTLSPVATAGRPLVINLIRDASERKRGEQERQAFAAQLERSNRDLQDFAYVASHDLQEPLRKIQAFGGRLQTKCGDALGADGRDYLERMQGAAERMQALITDLLAFSRVTTKAQPFVPVALAPLVRQVLSDLEVRVEQTGAQVELGELPTVDADPLQMRLLLQNLLSNALKFHAKGRPPVVQVRAELVGQPEGPPDPGAGPALCRLVVQDNGIGFDEKYLDRIFTPFQRLHNRGDYEGTGIGLAICRKIAERHGGRITAHSAPDQGATFLVTLPVHQAPEGSPR